MSEVKLYTLSCGVMVELSKTLHKDNSDTYYKRADFQSLLYASEVYRKQRDSRTKTIEALEQDNERLHDDKQELRNACEQKQEIINSKCLVEDFIKLEKELEETREEGRKDKRFRERCFAGPHEMWIKAAEEAERLNERYKTALETIQDFTNGYGDVAGIVHKRAREALHPEHTQTGESDE